MITFHLDKSIFTKSGQAMSMCMMVGTHWERIIPSGKAVLPMMVMGVSPSDRLGG
jgi:hypothetical protein